MCSRKLNNDGFYGISKKICNWIVVCCPASLDFNWNNEILKWLKGKIKWSRLSGFLWALTVHLVIQTLPYVVWEYWQEGKTESETGLVIALVFTLLTIAYSLREIQHHLQASLGQFGAV